MKRRKGFTLAEVLVTLAVIGVVAALTIPALIQSSNTKQAKTAVKKSVSVLNQALTMSIAENGTDASSADNGEMLRDLFDDYLSTLTNDTNSVTTSDGMIYTFWADSNCTASVTNNDPSGADCRCLVEVDINADKGSSTPGTSDNAGTTSYGDLYYLVILKESVVPVNDAVGITPNWDPGDPSGSSFRGASKTTPVGNIALEALLN